MTSLEVAVSIGSFAVTLAGMGFVWHVLRTSGANMAADEQRVAALVKNAPYDRLDNVLAKRD